MNIRSFAFIFFIISLYACENLTHKESAASINEVVTDFTDSFSAGQNNSYSSVLVGTLGKNQINMEIMLNGDQISGKYRSPMAQQEFRLEGEINRQQQNRFEIREFDQEGNQVGAFRGNIEFNKKYQGEWANMQGNMHAPFELETKKEVFLMSKMNQRALNRIDVDYRTSKLESPDQQCQVIDNYPILSGFTSALVQKQVNKLLKPAPLYERQVALNKCSEQLQDLQFEEAAKTESSVSVNMINPDILSITRYNSEFSPETQKTLRSSNVVNLDAQTGNVLSNEDLFVLDYDEALNSLITQKLTEKYEHDWGLNFEGIKPEKSLAFFPNQVLLTFNPYELGDFAPGQILISLSYTEMAKIINPNGPLSDMIEGQEIDPSNIQAE